MRGHDIDTDRIMPARFLKAVSFDGLERHVFEDDRAADPGHPFNDPRYAGAAVLIVNANFGCGSSREHAPQGLFRWGIKAVVGESFSDIFRGNATMIGLPCLTADRAQIEALQTLVESGPQTVDRRGRPVGHHHGRGLAVRRDASGGAAGCAGVGPVESDGDAARAIRRGPGRRGALPYIKGF